MTEPQPRMGHWPKIIRAEEHLASVIAEIDFWREQDVCTAIGKFETPEEHVIRVEERISPPLRLSLLIGDTITTLNSALDHLAFALVSHYDSDRAADPDRLRGITFPIHESETYTDKRGVEKPASFEGIDGVPDRVLGSVGMTHRCTIPPACAAIPNRPTEPAYWPVRGSPLGILNVCRPDWHELGSCW
jgi:hypothetical protein